MTLDRFVLDPWAPLSHKAVIGSQAWNASSLLVPTWVGGEARRLNAYKVLQAYIDNVSRHFLPTGDLETRNERREYGDANLMRLQILAALLGDDQAIVVEGAADFDPDLEEPAPGAGDEPPEPPEPPASEPGTEPAEPDEGTTAEEWADNEEARLATERQDWLRDWAQDERFGLKLIETERNAIGLGDGVYVLGWSAKKNRPRLRVFDPGFYFPVLEDSDEDEFPTRVHMAWEVVQDERGNYVQVDPGQPAPQGRSTPSVRRVRRITWELAPLPEGEVSRRYDWQDADDEPATVTCYMTDAVWDLSDAATPDDFSSSKAKYLTNEDGVEVNRLDLRIDFIPVVHVPNTVSILHHYGTSSLTHVAQILDDVGSGDTDLAAAARTTGAPPLTLSGTTAGTTDLDTYGPGQVFHLGPDGRADLLDTSKALVSLTSFVELLLQRMATNARIPEALLGRIRGQIPSGIALALAFGPLQSMVAEMRLVRDEKYPLLLKFAQRLAMAGGALPPGEVLSASVQFGSYLPVDRSALVTELQALLGAKAISRQTAVQMLIDAGMEVDDARAEVERIAETDYAGAVQLLDATGDEPAVRRYLGLPGEGPRPAVPPVTLPPVSQRFTQPGVPPPAPGQPPTPAPNPTPQPPAPTEPPR